ncbi:1-acylglycerol-3-phosphate O-acyltransferase Pnpla3-like [Uloborus diversus]|uniref:1-acylglycerol-3-phosphate O-acyltransferase Pnpla3-like n=1 Tax=Uloborus diversus TaxID=327109 RepID=UPI0024097DF6|nr:1-acylglycerol-3-phosphate O-acyltransferase Pnpla3-like [Uloborus diversus]
MNLSFAGCGFLGIYHVGVASCFREYAPHVLVSKIAGASVGSIAAAALICDVSLGQTTTDILSVAVKARSRMLGPLSPRFDLNFIVKESLERGLPPNAHLMCSGRLFISVTRWSDKKNVLLSQFNSRDELIQALLCSCFIPGYSGLTLPVFQGVKYVDGGLSDNLPVLDENTVTVSPFAGEHDICPQDESCNILQVNLVNTSIAVSPGNMYRMYRILFPPKPEILSKMCQQGFDDALKFLQRKNLIACTRCLGVQSSLCLAETEPEKNAIKNVSDIEIIPQEHIYDDCMDCRSKRQNAVVGNLPEAVVNAIQEACDQVNKGVVNWLFKHRPIKLLALLGMPYALSIDITILVFCKVWERLPSLRSEIVPKFQAVITLIKYMLNKLDTNRHLYSAKFSCQLAITEFDYTEDNVVSSYPFQIENRPPHETCIIKTEEERSPKRKISFKNPETPVRTLSVAEKRQQRKSYAGFTSLPNQPVLEQKRRKSFCEVSQPERVIRNMKFGFTVDLVPTVEMNDKKKTVVDALKSLGEEDNELNVIELTNKALSMERDFLNQHQNEMDPERSDTIGQILNASKSGALMSYYYVDDNKTVKITELYNVTDADTSMVLSDEERQVNNELQWEKDWLKLNGSKRCRNTSITDTFDDDEFDMSDGEYNMTEDSDKFNISDNPITTPKNDESFSSSKPRRKSSFIIVN